MKWIVLQSPWTPLSSSSISLSSIFITLKNNVLLHRTKAPHKFELELKIIQLKSFIFMFARVWSEKTATQHPQPTNDIKFPAVKPGQLKVVSVNDSSASRLEENFTEHSTMNLIMKKRTAIFHFNAKLFISPLSLGTTTGNGRFYAQFFHHF